MQIYVCVKHVPDTAAKITIIGRNQIDENITFLLNPYDEHAVEEASYLKNHFKDVEVIAVCVGKTDAENTLRSALAMGADRGILVTVKELPDSIMTARLLKAAIEQDGSPDLIFTGKESIDSEGFQTMFRLAKLFDMPVATNVTAFTLNEDIATVKSEMEAGSRQVIEMSIPCVVGVGKGLNKPRYPTLPDIMKARKKEIRRVDSDALSVESAEASMTITDLTPAVEKRKEKLIEGASEDAVAMLINILSNEEKLF